MVQLSRCPTPARQRGVEPGQQIPDHPGLDGRLFDGWHLREFSSRIEKLALDGDGARSENASTAKPSSNVATEYGLARRSISLNTVTAPIRAFVP